MGIGTLLPTLLPFISTWLALDLIQGHRWRSASGVIAIAPLDFWGKQELYQSTLEFVGDETPKYPKIIFRDKTPKNPNFQTNPVPKISPNYFRGFSGIKTQKKNPILNTSPSPKNPRCFFMWCPHPCPVPEFLGTGRGWGHGMKKHWGFFGDGVGMRIGVFWGFIPENPRK